MDHFYEALLSKERNSVIPEEDDWFCSLLGDWDFEYSEPEGRKVQGEWLFRRVLDGMAIEDLFICPSRTERLTNHQPDAEYGTTLRMYDQKERCYDMTYVVAGHTTRLKCKKETDTIVCSVLNSKRRWVFSEITGDSFHWQNISIQDDGTFLLHCEVNAIRKIKQ